MANRQSKSESVDLENSLGETRWFRVVVTLLVLFHLAAISSAALRNGIPPESLEKIVNENQDGTVDIQIMQPGFIGPLANFFTPYLDLTFTNHGYQFFGPDPPFSNHLVRYEINDPNGKPLVTGMLPDIKTNWPRLRYHRHFMLSSQVMMPGLGERALASFGRHLLHEHTNADHVVLEQIVHRVLSPEEVLAGKSLAMPESYQMIRRHTFYATDLLKTSPTNTQPSSSSLQKINASETQNKFNEPAIRIQENR